MDPDLNLLNRYHSNGDASAFQTLVATHSSMVFAAARRVTQDPSLAEEVAQDTFLALARRGPVRESVAAWLHHVARQKACNVLRGERRRQRVELSAAEGLAHEPDASWAEIEPLVDEIIDGLPKELRCLIIGHFLEQRTQQEMARQLRMSQSTVSRQIESALQALRDGLKHRGVMCGAGLASLMTARSAQAAPASLTVSLGKIAVTGTGTTTAPFSLIAMTTTTQVCLATAALAGAWLLLPDRAPAPAPSVASVAPQPLKTPVKAAKPPPPPAQPPHIARTDAAAEERELILAEFKRMGGTLREEFVDADIHAIIDKEFGNDRAIFEQHLAESGKTYEQFKTQRREDIIIQVMKARTTKDITDPEERKHALEDWLMDLRMKSLASSSKPAPASSLDE